MTKETLLSYEWFVDNEYLDEYLSFVNSRLDRQIDETQIYQRHHIIPACWFKNKYNCTKSVSRQLANEDPNQELVVLTLEEHLFVHELLLKCSTDSFQARLTYAYNKMHEKIKSAKSQYSDEPCLNLLHYKKKSKKAKKARKKKHKATSYSLKTIEKQKKVIIREIVKLFCFIDVRTDRAKARELAKQIIEDNIKIPE